jgi:hypothetical protein
MAAPHLHTRGDGLYEACCGKCMGRSGDVIAVDPAAAWDALVKLGWSSRHPGSGYAVCPACTANPESVDDAVRAAQKRRKRK